MQQDLPPLSNKQLLAFFAMIVGMFMAILDIQIVASSLPTIAAGLCASNEEFSWVQTSYIIAEVIAIPITGFAIKLLSTRTTCFISTFGFTVMSVLCSLANNIETMIIFRALQGLFGGAMIPPVFSTLYTVFPLKKRPTAGIIIGLVVTMAPTLGPTIGGYITEILSWHFMFLVNVIPGIFVCTIIHLYADFDQPNYKLLKNFDFLGIALLIITLASLQYVLEEGNKKGWSESNLILFLIMLSIVGFIVLIIRELTSVNPIVEVRTFFDKNFAFGCIYSFVIGIGLYGTVYLLLMFLFIIADFNTIQIGITMMVTGIAQFLSAPLASKILDYGMDLRLVLAIGLAMFGLGCYLNSFLTAEAKFAEFFLPQFIRGLALMFCFLPTNNIALNHLSKDKIAGASSLYNLTRNLGGAFGIAVISTFLSNKTKIFSQYLNENISSTSLFSIENLQFLQEMLNGKVIDPEKASYFLLDHIINKQAFVMTVNSIFNSISILFFMTILFLPFTSNVKTREKHDVH